MGPGNFPLLDSIRTVIIMPIIGLLFAVALVVFLYGAFEFLQGSGNDKTIKKAKDKMLYGILGLFLMASAAGVVNLLCNTIHC